MPQPRKSKTVRMSGEAMTHVEEIRELYARQTEAGDEEHAIFTGDAIRQLSDSQIIDVCVRKVRSMFEQAGA